MTGLAQAVLKASIDLEWVFYPEFRASMADTDLFGKYDELWFIVRRDELHSCRSTRTSQIID